MQQLGRNFTGTDFHGQAFGNGRFPDARLTQQHRVVFSPPVEDLDNPGQFFFAADDTVYFTFFGFNGQVGAELVEKFAPPLAAPAVLSFLAVNIAALVVRHFF